MAAQAKVIIKAEDNISRAVNSAKNSLSSLEGAALKMGSMLKNALGFTAVAASVKKLGDAVYGCFSDFEEADRKYRQLEMLKTTEFNQNRPLILTKRNITDFNQNMAECSRNTIISLSLAI